MTTMNNVTHRRSLTIALCGAAVLACASAIAAELPPSAKILDGDLIMYTRPAPTLSPDGKLVAYVSRGFICVADLEAGQSRRLFEVPGSWTHVFANSSHSTHGGDYETLVRAMTYDKFIEWQNRVTHEVVGLQWLYDSSAIVFDIRSYDVPSKQTVSQVWHVPLAGDAIEIAHSDPLGKYKSLPGLGTLTRDGRFIVGVGERPKAMIWDIAAKRPKAAPFDYLAPSSTSDRWIGVEKDTHQLVVVDENFDVIRRYEEFLPKNEFGFDMKWSPDERFIFWRQQIGFDHYSNWVGSRYDLETRTRDIFEGSYFDERIVFTGRRGEFVRIGTKGVQGHSTGLIATSQCVDIIEDGRRYGRSIWRIDADPADPNRSGIGERIPPVTFAPDFQTFIIGIPRQEAPYGFDFHLTVGRQFWRLSIEEPTRYESPYSVAGFAQEGKTIVGYDEHRLFAIPVSAIQTPENKVK
jgi:hypothetical protein